MTFDVVTPIKPPMTTPSPTVRTKSSTPAATLVEPPADRREDGW